MKKLLLTSNGLENPNIAKRFLELLAEKPREVRVLFVTTASTNEQEKFYVNKAEAELVGVGIPKEQIIWVNDLAEIHDTNNYDVMYVCGGNTFYLLNEIKQKGFAPKILDFIDSGRAYVGASAGSIILCPDIRHAKNSDKNFIHLQDTAGLNLVDKVIQPHYTDADEKIVEKFEKENGYTILRLPDNHALEIAGDQQRVIQ